MSTWRPAATRNDDPRRLDESLDRVADALGAPRPGVLGTVFSRWNAVVGDAVAAHARPASLSADVLVVTVDEPAWATQLRFLEADILARLQQAAGEPVAARIEVRVASPGRARSRRGGGSGGPG